MFAGLAEYVTPDAFAVQGDPEAAKVVFESEVKVVSVACTVSPCAHKILLPDLPPLVPGSPRLLWLSGSCLPCAL